MRRRAEVLRGTTLRLAWTALLAGSAGAGELLAQDPVVPPAAQVGGEGQESGQEGEMTPPVQVMDTAQLVFEREVFGYPTFERRNPFLPLLTAETGGHRFQDLRLIGTILSSEAGRSVAIFAVGAPVQAGGGQDQSARIPTLRARAGERVGTGGNTTVIEIGKNQVTVEVEEFGIRERRVMVIDRPGGQGGPR